MSARGVTPVRAALAHATLLVVALGCLVAVPLAAPQQPSWAWMFGAMGVALLLWVADLLVTLLTRRGRLRLRAVDGTTEVVGSPWSRPVDVAAPVVLVLALVGGVLSLVDPGPLAPGTTSLDAAAPVAVLAVLALLATAGLRHVLAGRRLRSRLRLHASGVEVSGPDGRDHLPWSSLTGVGPRPLALLGYSGRVLALPGPELRSDPDLVARLVEHYRTHPRERDELADGRAVERARTGRLDELGGSAR
ncbi:PH domain-containing protein [Nocardioides aurantiacus]|uniref:PH domain-containing protein n=1 Tax=Nocardioides aurantiacus TaxID=86796 RepID=UPI0014773776|nr:PH domain-containing protein [Nocardioides aurantiacus]